MTTKNKTNTKFSELRMPFVCYDTVFKALFIDEVSILVKIVSDITGMDYEILENNVTLETNELPVSRMNEKAKKCDFILKIDKDNILNLEINTSYYSEVVIKNLSYLFGIYSSSSKKGEFYNENILIRQVNLNCYDDKEHKDDKPLSKYTLLEEETHKLYSENISILSLDIVKCHDIYYNDTDKENLPEFIKWGTFIYNRDYDMIPSILKGIISERQVKKIMDKIDKLTNDRLFMSELEKEEWAVWEENSKLAYAKDEGISQGIEKNTKEMILSMIENKIDIDTISKITNKIIEEIDQIIKE